jgi:hypothetical protein
MLRTARPIRELSPRMCVASVTAIAICFETALRKVTAAEMATTMGLPTVFTRAADVVMAIEKATATIRGARSDTLVVTDAAIVTRKARETTTTVVVVTLVATAFPTDLSKVTPEATDAAKLVATPFVIVADVLIDIDNDTRKARSAEIIVVVVRLAATPFPTDLEEVTDVATDAATFLPTDLVQATELETEALTDCRKVRLPESPSGASPSAPKPVMRQAKVTSAVNAILSPLARLMTEKSP